MQAFPFMMISSLMHINGAKHILDNCLLILVIRSLVFSKLSTAQISSSTKFGY
jgi:hypothetical protein